MSYFEKRKIWTNSLLFQFMWGVLAFLLHTLFFMDLRTVLYDLVQQNHFFLVRPYHVPRGLWRRPMHTIWTCWGAQVQDEMGRTQWRKWDIRQWDCFCFSLMTSFLPHSPRCSINHRITEYCELELEATHKDREVQFLSQCPCKERTHNLGVIRQIISANPSFANLPSSGSWVSECPLKAVQLKVSLSHNTGVMALLPHGGEEGRSGCGLCGVSDREEFFTVAISTLPLCLTMKHLVWMKAPQHFSPELKNHWTGHLYTSVHNVTLYNHTARDPRSDLGQFPISLLWLWACMQATPFVMPVISRHSQRSGLMLIWINAEYSENCSTACQIDPATWLSPWAQCVRLTVQPCLVLVGFRVEI